jgi:hypothetical protein
VRSDRNAIGSFVTGFPRERWFDKGGGESTRDILGFHAHHRGKSGKFLLIP